MVKKSLTDLKSPLSLILQCPTMATYSNKGTLLDLVWHLFCFLLLSVLSSDVLVLAWNFSTVSLFGLFGFFILIHTGQTLLFIFLGNSPQMYINLKKKTNPKRIHIPYIWENRHLSLNVLIVHSR